MLRNASTINGYAIAASDGKLGTVSDFLFDDATWLVRWLVVDTGNWLSGRKVLLLVQEDGKRPAAPAEAWLSHFPLPYHCHIRLQSETDMARLARYVTGRGVGLVLSGGGARGFAHIGVIKALRQARIPIDLVGGTSMGAIIAACVALEWDDKEMYERMRAGFVTSNPLDDYAIPVIALTKGRKVERRLRRHFADARAEDMWRPYFAVASNLSNGEVTVLRYGLLWRALRASIAIPGLLPPVIIDGDVLADGGVMNNLPCDVMDAMRHGPVIGVDVTRYRTPDMSNTGPRSFMQRLFGQSEYDGPGIVSLLLRAATVGGTIQTRSSRDHAPGSHNHPSPRPTRRSAHRRKSCSTILPPLPSITQHVIKPERVAKTARRVVHGTGCCSTVRLGHDVLQSSTGGAALRTCVGRCAGSSAARCE